VQAYCATLASGAPTLQTGRITALAVAGKKRLDALPGVPTLIEAGVPDFVVEQWWGVVAPARTPPEALARLNRDIAASLEDVSLRKRVTDLAVEPVSSTPQAFRTFLEGELKRWARVAKDAGIQPE
jgi:tripartite-type tricarboxylate transporter receptor subunit TctC